MTLLLVDAGNSRIKWARVTKGRRGMQRGEPLRGNGAATFRAMVAPLPARTQVLAVNVAGRDVERALIAAARAAKLPPPRFLRSTAAAAGLVNGYDEPWRLGADRWAALIGAWHATGARKALCVVDVGTAMTIDFLGADGRHRGGYIVPGPTLAVRSLLQGTKGILRRSRGALVRRADAWPRSTLPAIEEGSREACAAMILRSHSRARSLLGRATRLLVTGGGARDVLPLLPAATRHVPDLVLQGVQVALSDA
jgi:type III pantothenate kinase